MKGIGVLFPGAGTLRGVFTTTDANGQRVFDEKGWEAAIQQVLAACKEFNVAVRLPGDRDRHRDADAAGLQRVRDQLGRAGFKAVDIGRSVGGRVEGDNK